MDSILLLGIIIFTGFILGELARLIKLPKIIGFILAGIFLKFKVIDVFSAQYIQHLDLAINIALAFITFAVGGTLFYPKLKDLGRSIINITFFEAELAFISVMLIFMILSPFLVHIDSATWLTVFMPLSMLLASMASPTDPSATLAVVHQYGAKGPVTSTILSITAFDDVLGIINFSIVSLVSRILIEQNYGNIGGFLLKPLYIIGGAIALGIISGFLLNLITRLINRETEGVFIVVILSMLLLCFGAAELIGVDQLLSTTTMGVIVVNFNKMRDKLFNLLTRYTDELIFILFFTISGMHLSFDVFSKSLLIIFIFVIFRMVGKYFGVALGSFLSDAPKKIRDYTAGGLVPQGGIVIGLALLLHKNPMFNPFADIVINTIIGATILNEIIGSISSKLTLKKAGETTLR